MTWQIILLIAIFSNALSVIFGKYIINDSDCSPYSFSLVFQGLTGILILLFVLIRQEFSFNFLNILPYLILSPLLYFVVNILRPMALKRLESSVYIVLLSTGSIWGLMLAMIFLGESVTLRQIIGIIVIMIGISIVSGINFRQLEFKKGELLTLLAAFVSSLAFICDAFVLRQNSAYLYSAYAFLLPAIFTGLIFPNSVRDSKKLFSKRNLVPMLLATVTCSIAVVCIYMAYQLGRNAAVIPALNQITTIMVVIMGITFLGEKNNVLRKLLATILSILGVLLII